MRRVLFALTGLALLLGGVAASLPAAELLPADMPLEAAIDAYINQKLSAEGVTPVPAAEAGNLARRLSLDLAGRIPTANEVREYVAAPEADKRQKLVERLMASPDFPFHWRNQFDTLLVPEGSDGPWREYLLQAFRENRPWDRMFREMLLGSEENPQEKGALAFLKTRARDLDTLTNDTSRLFFGVSINCAKCHDHPLVLDWTQDHYFGMASFFNRTYMNKRNQVGEYDEGLVKFKTTEGVEKEARLMFLTGAQIEEPPAPQRTEEEKKARAAKLKEDDEKKEGPPPAVPAFSRRTKLVELALRSEDNYFFSRSIINRIWAQMLGRGLVMPVDQMHSANPPTHPELLDWLARDLVTHGYDLRRLIRGITLSEVYARSSRWESAGEPPPDRLFAYALPRPLTPRQYGLALAMATTSPDQYPLDMPADQWAARRNDLENRANGFSGLLEVPSENFQVSVTESLLFSNSTRIQGEFLSEGGDRLVGKLKTIPDRTEQIQTATWNVFSRPADPEELAALAQYLDARSDRPVPALQQFVWTLLTSSESRFNY